MTVTISVGIGYSTAPHNLTSEQLLKSADQALYAAKKAGRNRSMTAQGHKNEHHNERS